MQAYTASLTGVFRTIFIILALFFAVRLLGRLLRPYLTGNKRGASPFENRQDARQEGEVRIEYTKKEREAAKKKDGKSGEYIDFEEVD